jgi:23S rRNA (uracil1939-C5)-methyltransferase
MSNQFADDRTEESQPSDPMEAPAPGPDVPHEPAAPVRAGRRRRRRHTLISETAELALGPFAPDGTTPADYNGRTIPVEKGIAGERAHATVLTLTGRNGWTRGSVTEVLEASADRVEALCPYFREHDCGGCEWQHIAYSAQLQTYKAGIVRDLLREAGIERDIDQVDSLDEPWRYRHSAAIALAKGAGFRRRRRQSVIPVRDCPISHPAISDLLATLNDWYDAGVYPDLRGQVWIEVKVVGSAETPLLQLVVGGIGGMNLPARPELHPLADALAALPNTASVCYKHPSGETHTYAGPAASIVEVGGQPYLLPAGSFFQTNLGLVPRLIERILSLIELDASHVAADIYCGAGLFTMPLARRAGRVIAIELDPAATAAAHETARLWGLTNIELFARPAEKAMDLLPDLDLALVDPPRSGLDPRVTAAIIAKRPRQFVYVSCNPVTLARDLRAFTDAGYTIHWLELFDFFPQTSHVETLVYLRAE